MREITDTKNSKNNNVCDQQEAHQTIVQRANWHAKTRGDAQYLLWLENGHVESQTYTFREIDEKAKALACRILRRLERSGKQPVGDAQAAALVITQPGLDFTIAFLGCLYAGVVAVPAYALKRREGVERLKLLAQDSEASLLICDEPNNAIIQQGVPADELRLETLCVEDLENDLAQDWQYPAINAQSIAFIQYTSGSTGRPKGVVVTHGNLMANQRMIQTSMRNDQSSVFVCWLPMFHDMGLIGNLLQPLYLGVRCVLMPPLAFVANPIRWLQAISKYRATVSGGPNFAYDLCVAKTTEAQRQGLDLSSWRVAFNGAEPIRAATVQKFCQTYKDYGFSETAMFPCYGMAEATLIISGAPADQPAKIITVDRKNLEEGRVVMVPFDQSLHQSHHRFVNQQTNSLDLVSSGVACEHCEVRIVNPETGELLADDSIGEVWVSGPHAAKEYRNKSELSEHTFRARTTERADQNYYLRTGDLGFLHNEQLYIAGRMKDLIILSGRNYYPQDIEHCAVEAVSSIKTHPAFARSMAAAFSVDIASEEALVVVVSINNKSDETLPPLDTVANQVKSTITKVLGAPVHDVLFVQSRLPQTSSGKIQRKKSKKMYLQGEFETLFSTAVQKLKIKQLSGDTGQVEYGVSQQ